MLFKTKDIEFNGQPRIAISLQDYPETWFIIGEVSIHEDDEQGQAHLSYNYDIIEGKQPSDIESFEKTIGDFIVWFIITKKDELVYKSTKSENE